MAGGAVETGAHVVQGCQIDDPFKMGDSSAICCGDEDEINLLIFDQLVSIPE
jgi:hypothetical protein